MSKVVPSRAYKSLIDEIQIRDDLNHLYVQVTLAKRMSNEIMKNIFHSFFGLDFAELLSYRHFVYYIINKDNNTYVGMSSKLIDRLKSHRKTGLMGKGARVRILSRHMSRSDCEMSEAYYIANMNPTINKVRPLCYIKPVQCSLRPRVKPIHNPSFYELSGKANSSRECYTVYMNHCFFSGERVRFSFNDWCDFLKGKA